MGCNSHISIEIQGQWSHSLLQWDTWALDIPESRDYRLYGAMAGAKLFGLFGYSGLVIISGVTTFLCLPFIPFLEVKKVLDKSN